MPAPDHDSPGTLTKNEQTVTEVYTVDEAIALDPSASTPPNVQITPSLRKVLTIGSLCNNAIRSEDGQFVGQSTDVALLNVLSLFGMGDQRQVSMLCQSSVLSLRNPRTSHEHQSYLSAPSASTWQ